MRIDRLFIRGYGPLRDRDRDFSAGSQGLHVVYGRNESGKSLSLDALEHALFGVPRAIEGFSPQDLQQIEVHVTLSRQSIDGTRQTLAFRRTRSGAFQNAGTPADTAVIANFLGGATRETFHQAYGLTSHRIRQGGQLLKQAEGDIATALYAAATGLERIRETEASLKEALGKLFTPDRKAKNRLINAALRSLKTASDEFKAVTQQPDTTTRLENTLAQLKGTVAKSDADLHDCATQLARITLVKSTAVAAREYHAARTRLAEIGAPPILPATFPKRLEDARTQITADTLRAEQVMSDRDELRRLRDGIELNEDLLAAKDDITQLIASTQQLLQIDRDIPHRDEELNRLTEQITDLLTQIENRTGSTLRESAIVSPQLHTTIRNLLTNHGVVDSAYETRRHQLTDAENKVAELLNDLKSLAEIPATPDLDAGVKEIRDAGDIETQFAALQKTIGGLREEYTTSTNSLRGLTTTEPPELIPVPHIDEVREFRDRLRTLDANTVTTNDLAQEAEKEIATLTTLIALLEQDGTLPPPGELEQIRSQRDTLLHTTANELHNSVAADYWSRVTRIIQLVEQADLIADRLREHSDKVSKREQYQSQIETARIALADAHRRLAALRTAREAVDSQWLQRWQKLGVNADSPTAMESWLTRHAACCAVAARLAAVQHEARHLDKQIADHRRSLTAALTTLGRDLAEETLTRKALLALVTDAIEARQAAISNREQKLREITSAKADASRARALLDQAQHDLDKWKAGWTAAMELLNQPGTTTAETGAFLLDTMQTVAAKQNDCDDKRGRLTKMKETRNEIRLRMRQISDLIGHPYDENGIQQLGQLADQKYREAERDRLQRTGLDAAIREKENTLDTIMRSRQRAESVLVTLRQEAQVQSNDELGPAWDRSCRYRKLLAEHDEWSQRFLAAAGAEDAETLLAECLAKTDEGHDADLAAVQTREVEIRDDRDAVRDKITSLQAQVDALGGDKSARAWADCQMHAAAIVDRVEEYLPIRLAAIALTAAARRYRDEHHAPVLRRASELFAKITHGEYEDIRFAENDLFALRADATKTGVKVAQMSDGTQDQVYLALRLAALQDSHARGVEPLPLILDDGLVHFDDDRTATMLEVLADVSASMQVIVFTHHRGVLEAGRSLAARVPDRLFVHELNA